MGKHRKLIDTWFQKVWNEGDIAHIHATCDIDMTTKGHRGMPLRGPNDFEQFYHMILNLAKDIHIELIHSVEDENWISAIYQFHGKRRDTNTPVEMTGSTMVRIEAEKITEVYEHVDFIEFFEGLDAMPLNTLEHCLAGKTCNHA